MPDTNSLAAALLAVQQNAPSIQKDAINPHFGNRYISLDSLMPQILPVLNANELVLTQEPSLVVTEGEVTPTLVTRVVYVPTGEVQRSEMPLLLDKQNSQGLGSAITYARRYALLAILGLVADQDDDGERASKVEVVNKRRSGGRRKAATPSGADDTDGY